jgi:UDP-N-acetylmuramate dehydrogenase
MTFSEKLIHIVRQKESLAPYTWLRVGGEAKFFAEPGTVDDWPASFMKLPPAG